MLQVFPSTPYTAPKWSLSRHGQLLRPFFFLNQPWNVSILNTFSTVNHKNLLQSYLIKEGRGFAALLEFPGHPEEVKLTCYYIVASETFLLILFITTNCLNPALFGMEQRMTPAGEAWWPAVCLILHLRFCNWVKTNKTKFQLHSFSFCKCISRYSHRHDCSFHRIIVHVGQKPVTAPEKLQSCLMLEWCWNECHFGSVSACEFYDLKKRWWYHHSGNKEKCKILHLKKPNSFSY